MHIGIRFLCIKYLSNIETKTTDCTVFIIAAPPLMTLCIIFSSTSPLPSPTERLMQFEHHSGFVVSSPRPLPRVAGQEEVANTGEEALPDIYPVSPFVSVLPPRKRYSAQDQYGMFHLTPVENIFSRQSVHTG